MKMANWLKEVTDDPWGSESESKEERWISVDWNHKLLNTHWTWLFYYFMHFVWSRFRRGAPVVQVKYILKNGTWEYTSPLQSALTPSLWPGLWFSVYPHPCFEVYWGVNRLLLFLIFVHHFCEVLRQVNVISVHLNCCSVLSALWQKT